jgi:hypothetical protein
MGVGSLEERLGKAKPSMVAATDRDSVILGNNLRERFADGSKRSGEEAKPIKTTT